MKLLESIRHKETGEHVLPLKPLSATLVKEAEGVSTSAAWDLEMVVKHELRIGCVTTYNTGDSNRAEVMANNERKVERMFAEALYGEVVSDLMRILVWSYRTIGSPELEEKINQLIRKMRP